MQEDLLIRDIFKKGTRVAIRGATWEFKGIEKAVKAEIKARIESGDDLEPLGAKMGSPGQRKNMRKPEEIAEMLLPAFGVEDLYGEPTIISGKLTIV